MGSQNISTMMGSGTISAADLTPRLWRRLSASFEAKIVFLSLIATFCALTMSFAAFQWLDWSGDQSDLATDQLAFAQRLASAADRALGPAGPAVAHHTCTKTARWRDNSQKPWMP